jgi:hypothetical protein
MTIHSLSRAATGAALALAFAASPSRAQGRGSGPDMAIDAATRSTVIDSVAARLHEAYVFPERATEMELALRARLAAGEYDRITSAAAFADSLTAHLRAVSHDLHLSVEYSAEPLPAGDGPPGAALAAGEQQRAAYTAYHNAYVERVERLAGNVGYLKLDGFAPAEAALEPIRAAMAFLAHTDALIIDLRENHGGRPAAVALLASWLFGERPVHLNTVVTRGGAHREEFWTRPEVPGAARYGADKPVYVLTSRGTFSAGEEFPYDLQALHRATIVGETTGGGAHPVGPQRATAHFVAMVPFARSVNPVTRTNWEGTGVHPDVQVAAADALAAAHRLALQALLPTATDGFRRDDIAEALANLH